MSGGIVGSDMPEGGMMNDERTFDTTIKRPDGTEERVRMTIELPTDIIAKCKAWRERLDAGDVLTTGEIIQALDHAIMGWNATMLAGKEAQQLRATLDAAEKVVYTFREFRDNGVWIKDAQEHSEYCKVCDALDEFDQKQKEKGG